MMLQIHKTSVAIIFGSVFFLVACQPKSTPADSSEKASAAQTSDAQVARLEGQSVKLNVELPACDGNNCPEFEVERLTSNYPWIDQKIDAEILKNLAHILEISKAQQTAQESKKLAEPAASAVADQNSPLSAQQQLEQKVKPYVQSFIGLDNELKALSGNHQINLMIKPSILKSQAPVATVVLNTSSYLGGAHGSAIQQYYNFDLDHEKLLQLNDLLLPHQKVALEQRAHEAFKVWVMESKLANSVDEYEQAWKFKLSNNFLLGDHGLILQYGEYEIGPYAVGLPRLVVPYDQLNTILKPEYLPTQFTSVKGS